MDVRGSESAEDLAIIADNGCRRFELAAMTVYRQSFQMRAKTRGKRISKTRSNETKHATHIKAALHTRM